MAHHNHRDTLERSGCTNSGVPVPAVLLRHLPVNGETGLHFATYTGLGPAPVPAA